MNNKFDKIMEYSPENKTVFEELSALCIDKKIVPYIGAGLSCFAGFPTWIKFLNTLYNECFDEYIPEDKNINFFELADKIEEELGGEEELYKRIYSTYGGNHKDGDWKSIIKKAGDNSEAVSFIPKLFFGPIITTNFDQILEHIHQNTPDFFVALPRESDLEKIEQAKHKRKRFLYKIHGCVSKAQSIVFTGNQYEKEYNKGVIHEKYLTKFFQGFSFLFLGCSLDINGTKDKPVEIWEKLIKIINKREMYHYAIIECKENATEKYIKERRKELETRRIYPILFESGKHESVKIILEKLLSINNCHCNVNNTDSNTDNEVTLAATINKIENKIYKETTLDYNKNQKDIGKNILKKLTITFKDKK